MAHQDGIRKKVGVILYQCKKGALLYRYKEPAVPIQLDFTKDPEVIENPNWIVLHNEQVTLLNALFQATQNEEDRRVLIEELSGAPLFTPDSSAQVFVFLARYYSFQKSLQLLTHHLLYPNTHFALTGLANLLYSDHTYLTDADLDILESELAEAVKRERNDLPKGKETQVPAYHPPTIVGSSSISTRPRDARRTIIIFSAEETARREQYDTIIPIIGYILVQARRIQYLRLRKDLTEGANFEINQDRDKLLDSLSSLGFSDKLTNFLKFAEVEFAKAQGTFSYKTCIDQIRSFFAELLTETAEKVARGKGETLTKAGVDPKYPVRVREYLKKMGFFSDQFELLVNGLYKFMSDEGTHTLGATKDVARIARNIAVEIGLLITKRVHQELTPIANSKSS